MPEDRGHLNGVALDDAGKPRFVTALGVANMRKGCVEGSVLLSVPEYRVVLSGLCMPHSTHLIDGVLDVLNSGSGEGLQVDPEQGTARVLARLPGYARGLAARGNIFFAGLSRLRDRHDHDGGTAPQPG